MKLGSISPIKKKEEFTDNPNATNGVYSHTDNGIRLYNMDDNQGWNDCVDEFEALEIVFSEEAFMETIKNQLMQEGDLEEKGLSLHQMLEGRARYIISHMDKIISLRRAE